MDITPQVINEVEFHQRMRGYDPDEVDDFLERVAVAVGQLHEQVGQARSRVVEAEQRAADAERAAAQATRPTARADFGPRPEVDRSELDRTPVPVADERVDADAAAAAATAAANAEFEALKRTLVLAQRTADAAIREAEEEAGRTTTAAQERAQRLLGEAGEEAHRLVRAAEQDARKAHEDTRQRLIKEVGSLETARDVLKGDIGSFERHIDEQRTRLRGTVTELQRLLDDPGRLRGATVPATSPVSLPASVRGPDPAPTPPAPASRTAASPSPSPPRPSPAPLRVAEAPAPTRPRSEVQAERAGDRERRGDRPAGPARPAGSGSSGVGDHLDEGAWARFAGGDGPPTQPVARTDPARVHEGRGGEGRGGEGRGGDGFEDGDDDAYLSELRKAMLDDTSAPDRASEGRDGEGFDPTDESGRGRFGRRRS